MRERNQRFRLLFLKTNITLVYQIKKLHEENYFYFSEEISGL